MVVPRASDDEPPSSHRAGAFVQMDRWKTGRDDDWKTGRRSCLVSTSAASSKSAAGEAWVQKRRWRRCGAGWKTGRGCRWTDCACAWSSWSSSRCWQSETLSWWASKRAQAVWRWFQAAARACGRGPEDREQSSRSVGQSWRPIAVRGGGKGRLRGRASPRARGRARWLRRCGGRQRKRRRVSRGRC